VTVKAGSTEPTAEEAIAKVFSHPVRVKAWDLFHKGARSPNEIARELGEPVGNVAYHVRKLEKFNCIELVETRQVRGATEHFYRAIARAISDADEWESLSPAERRPISRHVVQLIVGDAVTADQAQTFDSRPDRHLSRTPMTLDEQGWKEMAALCEEFMDRAFALQSESTERAAKSGGGEQISVVASLLFHEMPVTKDRSADE
jgi:hypothetical protein